MISELPNVKGQADLTKPPREARNLVPLKDINTVPLHFIRTEADLKQLAEDVSQYSELAIDLEVISDKKLNRILY